MELAELVRARNHLHAAGLDRGVGERDPGGHLQGRLEAEVGGILVPAHIGRVASVLGPDREMEQTDIRTDHVLDGVEDGGMVDDLVDPGEQEVRLEILALGEFSALGRLELLHGAPVPPRLLGGERVDRVDEAVAVVALDLRLGQLLAQRKHAAAAARYPLPFSGEGVASLRGVAYADRFAIHPCAALSRSESSVPALRYSCLSCANLSSVN